MPKTEFRCNAKPSLFAYPPPLEDKKAQEVEKVDVAILSITNKKKLQQTKRSHDKSKESKSSTSKKSLKEEEKMEVDEAKADAKIETKPEPEPNFFNVTNPSRVVRAQLKTLALPENIRYKPLKTLNNGGIILLRDNKPQEPEEIVELSAAGGASESSTSTQAEAKPHTPFEFALGTY